MKVLKRIYKVFRSILFTAIIFMAVLYLALYLLVAFPPVQNFIKNTAERELNKITGGKFKIGEVEIFPFNEIVLSDVSIYDLEGKRCINSEKIGAGIELLTFLKERKIVITYAELLSPDISLTQKSENSPLNIQFLIDAFSSKDKTKPPTKFDLRINSVIIRKGLLSYSKLWIPGRFSTHRFNPSHIRITDINADIDLPRLSNEEYKVNLRRLAFNSGDFQVEKIGGKVHITPHSISIKDLVIKLPDSELCPSDLSLNFVSFNKIKDALRRDNFSLIIVDGKLNPYDFRFFLTGLDKFNFPLTLNLEAEGNLCSINTGQISLSTPDNLFAIGINGEVKSLNDLSNCSIGLEELKFRSSQKNIESICQLLPLKKGMTEKFQNILPLLGDIDINIKGEAIFKTGGYSISGFISTSECGELLLDVSAIDAFNLNDFKIKGKIIGENINPGRILGNQVFGPLSFTTETDIHYHGKESTGQVVANIPEIEINGRILNDINFFADKNSNSISGRLSGSDGDSSIDIIGELSKINANYKCILTADLINLVPDRYIPHKKLKDLIFNGTVDAELEGVDFQNLIGEINLNNFSLRDPGKGILRLNNLHVYGTKNNVSREDNKSTSKYLTEYGIESDWIDAKIVGDYTPVGLLATVKRALKEVLPTIIRDNIEGTSSHDTDKNQYADYNIVLKKNAQLVDFFSLPVEWLTDCTLSGKIDSEEDYIEMKADFPYLTQKRKNLISDTSLTLEINGKEKELSINFGTLYPTKKGDLRLDLDVTSHEEIIDIYTVFNRDLKKSFYGDIHLQSHFIKKLNSGIPGIRVEILPTSLFLSGAEWRLSCDEIEYNYPKDVTINGFNLRHNDQFVLINGNVSSNVDEKIRVDLADIDLAYIFDTLNINYVNFGGMATGTVYASDLVSGAPRAEVEELNIRSLSYNGTELGDGAISASWDNLQKCVKMVADIREDKRRVALMNGGIWVTRDSLSLGFDANKVNVGFLQPFMSAFAEKVEGRASGKALLYGTFKDIDMKGRLFADTISIKLGFTNVTYSGSDSIIINPGRIEMPGFTLYDKDKHTAVLKGTLTHNYFHEPVFNFGITEIKSLLCYDTNQFLNPDWYGKIYGSGTAAISGKPGYVGITANVVTEPGSEFTFVLSDRQDATDYEFITFTDNRRREQELQKEKEDKTPEFIKNFRKKQELDEGIPTIFDMQIRADITPVSTMNIIMDPIAGDKIRANGMGNMFITYSSESDEMKMFGRYTLESGVYNFSLQDLILKDFIIKQGSTISFNGNPLDAHLDITAAYRVNTNLTDLDKSFANDKDLNRTNVPVDALLNVRGELQNPSIDFDIDLPTLTDETSRKVKSIISTQDMMSRQIIYLLALNRFYTPSYMGNSSNGGEWASVASSTLSSQLSSMLGQLTDKVNVMPSLRSDKGDFSDVEVDVALSSSLLNNRLLLNGNFGYRDRATSNTTFVGDFDIEYLLSANGNLRLKAYNHFNDQNYYLKSALTTQGLGIIYRKEFDNPFTFLKRKKRKMKEIKKE